MGVFGFAEVITNLAQKEQREVFTNKVTSMFPTRDDWKRMIGPVLRGTALGSALGILPGGGAALGAFGAYSLEKKISKHGAEFGHGAIEGVAAPESGKVSPPRAVRRQNLGPCCKANSRCGRRWCRVVAN
jgi:TctA family transporter